MKFYLLFPQTSNSSSLLNCIKWYLKCRLSLMSDGGSGAMVGWVWLSEVTRGHKLEKMKSESTG